MEQKKRKTILNKRPRPSLLTAAGDVFISALAMIPGMVLPVSAIFLNAQRLGVYWLVLLFLYSGLLAIVIYALLKYRDIMETRSYFTVEEFDKEFRRDLWWIRIMDSISGFERDYRH